MRGNIDFGFHAFLRRGMFLITACLLQTGLFKNSC
jgi:hypothetical protein